MWYRVLNLKQKQNPTLFDLPTMMKGERKATKIKYKNTSIRRTHKIIVCHLLRNALPQKKRPANNIISEL
jgi:hypothetical protein